MSARPWYKRYGADFVFGTMGLPLDVRGAYSICIDLIYDRGGPIPDDARWLAGICGVSLRKWASIRDRLIGAGKLIEQNGYLINPRAFHELETDEAARLEAAKNGAIGGAIRAENALKTSRKRAENEPKVICNSDETEPLDNKNNALSQGCLNLLESRVQIEQGSEDKSSGASSAVVPDLNKRAWAEAVALLTERAGITESNARKFFGALLSKNRLDAAALLPSLAGALVNGTADPQGYLTKAAAGTAARRNGPADAIPDLGWI